MFHQRQREDVRRKGTSAHGLRPYFEPMEPRRLMSAVSLAAAASDADVAVCETEATVGARAVSLATVAAASDVGDGYRYLKRVGDDLHAWATADGSGAPVGAHPLPFAGDLVLGGAETDDVVTIDMSGGNIVVEGKLTIAAGAGEDVVRLVNGDGRMLTVGGVDLDGETLDLGSGGLKLVDGDIYEIEGLVASARNGSTRWQGRGIGTTAAYARTGLAPLRRGGDVVVKFTYVGDMSGDGRIDSDDYFRIDSGFLAQPAKPLYEQGDLNFDDKVDSDDYFIIDGGFIPPFDPL